MKDGCDGYEGRKEGKQEVKREGRKKKYERYIYV
jgi:hypothetical protein